MCQRELNLSFESLEKYSVRKKIQWRTILVPSAMMWQPVPTLWMISESQDFQNLLWRKFEVYLGNTFGVVSPSVIPHRIGHFVWGLCKREMNELSYKYLSPEYTLTKMYEWCNGKGASFKCPTSYLWDLDFIIIYVYSKQLVLSLFFIKSTSNMFFI